MNRIGIFLTVVLAACKYSPSPASPGMVQTTGATISDAPPTLAAAPPADLTGRIDFREYAVPRADSLPHDAIAAPDGALWFTEMKGNAIGRLNPSTGLFREFPLPERGSDPHGLAADRAGNIWFTANAKGYIGKLEPASEKVTVFPMPDARAKDPHSLVFAPDGRIWFTVQQGNFVGRLDPSNGKIDLKLLDRPGALPYGIVIGRDGAAYVAELGANRIARIDPETMAIHNYELASGARPRRIALAPDGSLFYTDFARGMLGRLIPVTGRVEEFQSPSGATSAPYAIAVTRDGAVWYSETGPLPNTLVRFDWPSHAFSSMPLPSGNAVIRNMDATPDGRVFIAESGVNKVAVLRPTEAIASR